MTPHPIKRILAILLSVVLVFGLIPLSVSAEGRTYDGTEKLYADLGSVDFWLSNNAVQRAYFYGSEGNAWSEFTQVSDTVYETTIPSGSWTHVILVRCNPEYTGSDYWSSDCKWNQTGNIELDAEKNYIESFTEEGTAVWGTWPQETPTPDPDPTPTEIPIPNGDFENGAEGWTFLGISGEIIDNTYSNTNATHVLNVWASDTEAVSVSARYSVWLTAGTYHFTFRMDGANQDGRLQAGVNKGEQSFELVNHVVTLGWDDWFTTEMDEFTLTEPAEVTFWLSGTIPAGYWAHLDDLKLYGTGEIYTPPLELTEITLPNGNFESGDATNWILFGLPENPVRSNEWNTPNSSYTLNLWTSNDAAVEIHAKYPVKLTEGTYKFSFLISGQGVDSNLKWKVLSGENALIESEESVTTVDWNVWDTYETATFTLEADTEIVFDFGGTGPVGYWGDLDDLKLFGTGSIVKEVELDHTPTIAVEKVDAVSEDDFMRGTDVSSFLSLMNSGAKFYDYDGNALDGQGFFDLLASAGFNYVRLRVWNDPFDSEGHGYGGGNCDVEAAKTMGKWATNAGLKVLIDFHYSDFWADPGKQKVPKAWSGYTVDQKVEAVNTFTYNSLKTLLDAGVDVGMVQVGNETTSSICGESSWANKAQIFSAGSAAIRQISEEYDHSILVAIHFTNPERSGNYAGQAKNLNDYNVDYDVFASSWYPYWHGTTSNLTSVLKNVADTYNKKVIVAETSWAWTLDDGDGHANTVRVGNNDSGNSYPFSVQGQADELTAAAKAVAAVGDAGIGVFYWENAWIPVQYAYDENGDLDNDILNSNKAKWEAYGSGWASSYAAEYDPNDAGVWFGGSAVDNQAMFDFQGKALDSLYTWQYMMIGTEDLIEKKVEEIEAITIEIERGGAITLPETVKVTYNVGGSKDEPVVWNEEDLSAADAETPGEYTIHGTVTLSYDLGSAETTATVKVKYPNLLLNPSFEESDLSMYSYANGSRTKDDPHSGTWSFHFYNASAKTVTLEQTVELQPGNYTFSLFAQGDSKGSDDIYIYVNTGEAKANEPITESFALSGWAVWQNPEIEFSLTSAATVTVGLHLAFGAGGWGTIDDLYLGGEETQVEPQSPEYYLVGTMNEWTASEAYKLTAGDEEGKFVLTGVELTANTEVKIVDAVNEVWYPDNIGNYVVAEDGTYNVEFWPAGNMGEEYHGGFFKLTKQEAPPEPEYIKVFFVDENDMETVLFYAFGPDEAVSAAWPGEAMEPIGKDVNDHNVYKIELDKDVYDRVIFNNGDDWQTVNLAFITDAGENDYIVYFGNSNETDDQGHYKAWPADDVEKIVNKTEPTCTEDGSIVYESYVTGEQRTEVLEALGHDWGEWVVTTQPTCVAPGVETRTCARCSATEDREVEQLDGEALQAAIAQAQAIDQDLYTEESVLAMTQALAAAQTAYENAHTQEEVDAATQALLDAIEALELKPVVLEPEYYLVGTMNEWTASEPYKLTAGDEEGKFVLTGAELTANTEVKIVDAVNEVWYPDNIGNYVVLVDGTYDVEFWPAGNMGEEYHGGFFKLTKQHDPLPEPVIDVFFVDEIGLDAVYCYAFGDGSELAAWPGIALETIGVDRNGNNVYEIEIDSGKYDHVIFTDGDWQTIDLPFVEDAGENAHIVYFGNSNESDEQGHFKAWPAEDVFKEVSRTEPTCTEPGEILLESLVTGQQTTEEIAALGHDPAEAVKENEAAPSCTEPGGYDMVVYCNRCGEELSREHTVIDALGHDWDDGVVTKKATNTEEGEMTYTCSRCGATRTEVIPMDDFFFDDVQDPDRYYFGPVYWAYYHDPQITKGVTDTMFMPNNDCTRAQIVTFLWAAAGKPEPETTENPFVDVPDNCWYFKAVLWAVENNITSGTGGGKFSPSKTCTRAQTVTFLWAAAGKPEPKTTENPFTDVPENSWYYKAVLWASENKITSGTGNGKFSPGKVCTRGQIVTFLYASEMRKDEVQ